ncbi:MAG: ATP-binding protein [Polyangiaceae bacterium]
MRDLPESTVTLFMSSPTPGYLTRREGGQLLLVAINDKAQAVTKLPPSMIGRPLDPLYADQPALREAADRVLREGRSLALDLKLRRADLAAAHQTMRLTLVPLGGEYLAAFSEDVAQPTEVRRVLADVEARSASIVGSLMDGVMLLDEQGSILLSNPAAASIFQREEADLLRKRPEELGVWRIDGRPATAEELPWRRALASGEGVSAKRFNLRVGENNLGSPALAQQAALDSRPAGTNNLGSPALAQQAALDSRPAGPNKLREARSAGGEPSPPNRWVLASARPTRVEGTIRSIALALTDITALEESAAALDRTQRFLDAALHAGQLGVFEWDVDTEVGSWSPQLSELLGAQRMPGIQGFLEIVHPEDRARVAEVLGSIVTRVGSVFDSRFRVVRVDGEVRWVRVTGRHLEEDGHRLLLGVMADVSERQRIQEAFARHERLESLGRLAGGIAHDFNNLLTVILSSLSLADPDASPAVRDELTTARYAAERARELTWRLLAFARRQIVEIATLDVAELVRRIEQLLRRLVGDEIALSTESSAARVFVHADAAQLEQVLVNLVVNARDAMPRGGTISIATRAVDLGATEASQLGLPTGEFVVLEVRDSGEGITPEVRAKLFEPFFTTKTTGTGLGLASASGAVRQLGGTIVVDSTVGEGSTFRVYLPRVAPPPDTEQALASSSRSQGRGESILLVDDDALVRKTTRRVLERLGYSVTVAADGASALQLAETTATPFAAVITDMSMPGMSGSELVTQLRERQPSLGVLVVSGNPPPEVETVARSAFLQKPFTIESLAARVREVLSRQS